MNKSILHFNQEGTLELEKIANEFFENPNNIDQMVEGVLETLLAFGLNLVTETLEELDEGIRQSSKRKKKWNINRKEKTQLLCRLGNVVYERTLFQNKKEKNYRYLLDDLMGLDAHTRMTEGAEAALIDEAIDSSYRKGGLQVSLVDQVTKQTVKNKVHALHIPEAPVLKKEKKQIEILYIDADEDHIAKQFNVTKGDIKKGANGITYNTMLGKMVYVYEGIHETHKGSKRKELLGKRYFGGIYQGKKGNGELWEKVSKYISETYDEDVLKKIYINGDGAAWIKQGVDYIPRSEFVLDRFHLSKYIQQATSHLLDSKDDVKCEIYQAIARKDKKEVERILKKIAWVTESDTKRERVQDTEKYLMHQWKGIMVRVDHPEILGCSAEGHISHTFSSRMSSRPMGWSKHGANQMCKLCCYKGNNGQIIQLVQEQKEYKATGTDAIIRAPKEYLGKFASKKYDRNIYNQNRIQATIPGNRVRKQIAISTHLSGL